MAPDDASNQPSAEAAAESGNQPSAASPLDAYWPILKAYEQVESTGDVVDGRVNLYALTATTYPDVKPFSYAMKDVSGDGVPELFIAMVYPHPGNGDGSSGTNATYRLYDAYRFVDGEAQHIVDAPGLGFLQTMLFYEDGTFSLSYFKDDVYYLDYLKLDAESAQPLLVERLETRADGTMWYTNAAGMHQNVTNLPDEERSSFIANYYSGRVVDECFTWNTLWNNSSIIYAPVQTTPPKRYVRTTLMDGFVDYVGISDNKLIVVGTQYLSYDRESLYHSDAACAYGWARSYDITPDTRFTTGDLSTGVVEVSADEFAESLQLGGGMNLAMALDGETIIEARITQQGVSAAQS